MFRSTISKFRRPLTVLGLCAAAAVPFLAPGSAQADWYRPYGWRPRVVIGAPVFVPPPPVVVVRGPYAHWVPGHYDFRGYFIRGHWA
jgi:hypothetical protein